MNNISPKKITINAAGKRIGRLASEISIILNGKDSVEYVPNRAPNVSVEVENASGMQVDRKKKEGKVYQRYTGYFGGRKEITLGALVKKKGFSEVLRRAVYGMLPGNRLRNVKMKNLHIQE